MALIQCSPVCFESSQCCFQVARPVYPLLRMWQRALDKWFTLPLAITQMIARQTPTSPNSICSHDDDSTRSICSMKSVVRVVKDPHGLIWPMVVTLQKWFTIFNMLIQNRSVPCSCSTVTGGLCIIMIMISPIWDQTSANNQFNYMYYYYDMSTKPRIK